MPNSFVDAPGTFRPMLWLTLPVLVEQMLHMLVGFTDLWLTGNFLQEEAYVAAMTLMIYALWLVGNLFGFVALGSTAMIARFAGARPRDGQSRDEPIDHQRPHLVAPLDGNDAAARRLLSARDGPQRHGGGGRHAILANRALRAARRDGRARGRRLPPRRRATWSAAWRSWRSSTSSIWS